MAQSIIEYVIHGNGQSNNMNNTTKKRHEHKQSGNLQWDKGIPLLALNWNPDFTVVYRVEEVCHGAKHNMIRNPWERTIKQ